MMSSPVENQAVPHSPFHFFIDRPVFAIVLAVLTTLLGLLSLSALPISQYPDVVPPQVVVTAVYPGANASTVADTVAAPIEQQVNGVENMLYMESQCTNDGSMRLIITFKVGTDPDTAQVLVQNRVAIANASLPAEVKQIGVVTKKQSSAILLVVNIFSPIDPRTGKPAKDQLDVSNFATINVRDEIARLPGIGEVAMFGQRDYAMRIWLNPDRMADLSIGAGDVVDAIRAENAQVAAGQIGQPPIPKGQNQQITLNTLGRLKTKEEFEAIILKSGGEGGEALVRMRDVARVELGAKSYDSSSQLDGKPSVGLAIFQLPGANALSTAKLIKAKMKDLQANRFEEGIDYEIVFDPTEFVSASISEVVNTLFEAFILVFIVVIVFLQNWRAAVIPMLAVPVALIGTLTFLFVLGFSINTLTLFGLVLAIGIVVDDAIVVVEAVEFHLARGLSPRDATRRAMSEVSQAVIGVSLVLAAVFIPAAAIPGITGSFFKQFAVTIAISTLISAFNSLTLTPALCPLLLRHHGGQGDRLDQVLNFSLGWFFRSFNYGFGKATLGYLWSIKRLMRFSLVVMLVYGGLLVLTYIGFSRTPSGFLPQQDQGYVMVNAQLLDGASLERSEEVMQEAVRLTLGTDGVANAISVPGFSLLAQANVSNYGAMYVPLKPFDKRKGITGDMVAMKLNEKFGGISTGMVSAFGPPPILGLGSGGGFKLQVLDYGQVGYSQLEGMTSNLCVAAMQERGIIYTLSTFQSSAPQSFLNVDRERAKQMNVSVSAINEAIQVYMGSLYVNDITLQGRNWQVTVQADGEFRRDEDAIRKLKVRGPSGEMIPLAGLVKIDKQSGPSKVNRYQMYPAADILGFTNPGMISSGEAIARMEALADRELPKKVMGYEWTDMAFQEKKAANTAFSIPGVIDFQGDTTLLIFGLSVLIAFLVMAALYESWLLPLAIILVVPMCLLCAVAGLMIAKLDLNVFSQIGLVVLIGLATKNAILIVEYAKQKHESGLPRFEAALEACRQRLRPILMTSFAFILGVLPLLIGSGAGAEMRFALGTAVFSGMLGVTAFGVFFTPVFYLLIQRFRDQGSKPSKPGSRTASELGPIYAASTLHPAPDVSVQHHSDSQP